VRARPKLIGLIARCARDAVGAGEDGIASMLGARLVFACQKRFVDIHAALEHATVGKDLIAGA
jgi:hypothetical protein